MLGIIEIELIKKMRQAGAANGIYSWEFQN